MRPADGSFAHRYPAEAADDYCVPPDVAARVLQPKPWRRLAVLGDLVTGRLPEEMPGYANRAFTDRLGDALDATHRGFDSLNLATPFLSMREIRAQQLDAARTFRPDIVVVSAGAHDCLYPRFNSSRTAHELERILRPLAVAGSFVVTVGMFDQARVSVLGNDRRDPLSRRFAALDRATRRITRALGGLYVDLYNHPLARSRELLSSDGYHASARGHAAAFAALVVGFAEPR